jgi:predicted GNAT family acetyltransferase
MLEVRRVDATDCAGYLGGLISPLANHYIKNHNGGDGVILCAFIDGKPCGALVCGSMERNMYVRHVEVVSEFRRRGVCRDLVASCLMYFKSMNQNIIYASVALNSPGWESMDALLKKMGFFHSSSSITIINYYNDHNIATFNEFMRTRGDRLLGRMARRGYSIRSFKDSTPAEKAALEGDMGTKYHEALNPFGGTDDIIDDLSFIVYDNLGFSVAYCVLARFKGESRTSLVSKMSARADLRKTGMALAALMTTLRCAIESGRYDKTIFTFRSGNADMFNLDSEGFTIFQGNRRSESRIYEIDLSGREYHGAKVREHLRI